MIYKPCMSSAAGEWKTGPILKTQSGSAQDGKTPVQMPLLTTPSIYNVFKKALSPDTHFT